MVGLGLCWVCSIGVVLCWGGLSGAGSTTRRGSRVVDWPAAQVLARHVLHFANRAVSYGKHHMA